MQVSASFVTSAADAEGFPRDRLPEVAFVGRSNVGKSSLINALARRTLARTSAAPGKTRLANFYRVQRGSAPPLYLVDLPGYGYARGAHRQARGGLSASKAGGAAAGEFLQLTEAYFARQETPIATILLVDSRHPGLESDMEAWAWLKEQKRPCGIVGTKVDKLTRAERARNTRQLESLFDVPVLLVSVQDGDGLEQLWKLIAKLPNPTAAPEPPPLPPPHRRLLRPPPPRRSRSRP
ncbi:MAG TPA: ribosome biogenesis GTP-binding protein YihA/YsxC [Vicinamibacterales bacterium]|nr:ribosome biogenesis GTP-binding protein YihA/YsxC [Vicinamibacterales bacterium]